MIALNMHNPYSVTEIEVTTEVQLSQEKGIGSNNNHKIRSPTVSNSLCPPISRRKYPKYICDWCGWVV